MIDFIQADVLEWAAHYDGPKFHALLCDPPYHLTSGNAVPDVWCCDDCGRVMGGQDRQYTTCPKCGGELVRQRAKQGGGFMGKAWDGGDIAFRAETWAALGEHLLPGAFGMAFASSRGYHRMAVAIEDAGFVLHSMIGWVYGSGFPKATRIDTQVDRAAGAEREVLYEYQRMGVQGIDRKGDRNDALVGVPHVEITKQVTAPATPLASTWSGHRYGLQALKPALEPIAVFAVPKGIEYNQLQEELRTIGLLLEELWATYASDAETLSLAARGVNTVLSNALGLTDQSLRVSGSLATGADASSTKRPESCESTAASGGGIVPENATLQPRNGEGRGHAHNAVKSSESETGNDGHGIAAGNVLMPPDNAPCWKTPCEMGIDTDTLTGILRSNLARARFDLSTIWLWRLTWVELCNRVNRYTIETARRTTTESRILSYLLRRITQSNQATGSTKSSSVEALLYASDANNLFTGLLTFPLEPSPTVRPASLDPICVFQKPYAGRPVDSITSTGAGALWIEGARVGVEPSDPNYRQPCDVSEPGGKYGIYGHYEPHRQELNLSPAGRWPSNLILDPIAAAALGRMSGERPTGVAVRHRSGGNTFGGNNPKPPLPDMAYSDTGTAARFFQQCDWALEQAEPMFYAAKASRRERDSGLPNGQRCTHPTVKALSLTKYLATLLLPPAEYAPRRILVPFAGVGSECLGAALAGWDEVTGIEAEAEYVEMARARAGYWLMQPSMTLETTE